MKPLPVLARLALQGSLLLGVALLTSPAAAQRMVFAHYMLTNQDYQGDTDPTQEKKIASYEREIQQAQAAGIDGFALNAGGWLHETYYIRYAAQMFEAAVRLHSGFKLFFSADMCCGNSIEDVEDMMRRFAANPRYADVYFRHNSTSVLSTFAGDKLGVDAWKQLRADLLQGTSPSLTPEPSALAPADAPPGNAPLPIFLVPAFFWGRELPARQDIARGVETWASAIDGSFYWGIAGVPASGGALDQLHSSEDYAGVLHSADKLYMAPVCLQFWGANANRYYEYSGAEGMQSMWMDAINKSHPEWIEIITWNDFIEGTYVSPIDDPNAYPQANFLTSSGMPLGIRDYFHSHAAATALLPFFIQWYKTGREPRIEHDSVYYFYRTQPKDLRALSPPVANRFGPVADVIYVTTMLTAPAKLRVTSGGKTTVLQLPAGVANVRTPFGTGARPVFALMRAKHIVASSIGKDAIPAASEYNDFYYSSGAF